MKSLNQTQIPEILAALNTSAVIAVPTETVYGLAVKFDNPEAINKLSTIKQRGGDSSKIFTLMVANCEDIAKYALVSPVAEEIIKENLPGELTVVLTKNPDFANPYYDNYQTIGIRVPNHRFMLKLLKETGPLIVTSANLAGLKPAVDSQAVERDLPEVDAVVIGQSGGNPPSTVVILTTPEPKVVRQGRVVIS